MSDLTNICRRVVNGLYVMTYLFLFLQTHESNAQGSFNHTTSINTFPTAYSEIVEIRTDAIGNMYVLGMFIDTIVIGNDTLAGAANYHLFLEKRDSSGNHLWHKKITIGGSADRHTIILGAGGQIYFQFDFQTAFQIDTWTLNSTSGIAVGEIDGSGNVIWVQGIISNTNNMSICGLAQDANGNLYVGSNLTNGVCYIGTDSFASAANRTSGFISMFTNSGTWLWSREMCSILGGSLSEIAMKDSCGIYFAGNYYMGSVTAGPYSFSNNAGSLTDLFIGLYDTSGTVLWAHSNVPNNQADKCNSISTDLSGNVFLTGYCGSTFELDTILSSPVSPMDLFVAKFDPSGNIQWLTRLSANTFAHQGEIILNDNGGNSYVGAWYQRPNALYDFYIGKFGTDGELLWADTSTGTGDDYLYALALNPNGTVIMGGYVTSNPAYFGNDSVFCSPSAEVGVITSHANPRALLSGIIYEDANGNGVQDAQEDGLANNIVLLVPGPYHTVTDQNGYYRFITDTGSYTINNITPLYYLDISPVSPDYIQLTVNGLTDTLTGNDFGVKAIPGIRDLRTTITAPLHPRPGQPQTIYVTVKNVGTTNEYNCSLTLLHEDTLIFSNAIPMYNQYAGNTLSWNIDTLNAGSSLQYACTFYLPPDPTLTGMQCTSIASVNPLAGDSTANDNADTLEQVVTNSLDPNHKYVDPEGSGSAGFIPPSVIELEYTICFQNTGTDTAFTIYLTDTIHPLLDITTLCVLASSHSCVFQIQNPRIATWTFNQIMLPDSGTDYAGSNGFVRYKIRMNPGLNHLDVIHNTASIYFDYNAPVITNTVVNTIDTANYAAVPVQDSEFLLMFSPNPFVLGFNVYTDSEAQGNSIEMYDLNGRIVKTQNIVQGSNLVMCPELSTGIYICQVYDHSRRPLGIFRVIKIAE